MKPTRPPGRPPLDRADPSVPVMFRLPSKQYDALWAKAQRDRVSVSEVIRRTVKAADTNRK